MADTTFTDNSTAAANRVVAAWLNDVNNLRYGASSASRGAALLQYMAGAGLTVRTAQAKMTDVVSVKDYGAVGDGVTDDTAALVAAAAAGVNIYLPPGTYKTTSTINITAGVSWWGAGQYKTNISYSGTTTAVLLGDRSTTLRYNCELRDLSVFCTGRQSTIIGVELQNCVYFNVENVTIIGSGNPNSGVGAEQVLYGSGLYLTNNSIIGRVSHVSCRLWDKGYYLETLTGSQSYWTAAIVFEGQGEVANNMSGIVVGKTTTAFYSGAGCVFRDLAIQGNYTVGIALNTGDNTVIDSCYFEGNANYDVTVGTAAGASAPISVKIKNCRMDSADIGTTVYGTFPYLAKVYVNRGSFTTIDDNDMSISTSIPLVIIESNATATRLEKNRFNSGTAATFAARVTDNSTTTISRDNEPEKAFVKVGSFTRALDGASASVAYTGVGFRPTSIEFVAAVDTGPEWSQGFADASGGRCMNSDATGAKLSSAHAIRLIRDAAGKEQSATLTTFDADGFTLAWTKTGAPPANTVTVNYVARR